MGLILIGIARAVVKKSEPKIYPCDNCEELGYKRWSKILGRYKFYCSYAGEYMADPPPEYCRLYRERKSNKDNSKKVSCATCCRCAGYASMNAYICLLTGNRVPGNEPDTLVFCDYYIPKLSTPETNNTSDKE